MAKLKCVLFDMDGVLIDSQPGFLVLLRQALSESGVVELTHAQALTYIGMSMPEITHDLCTRYELSLTPDQILDIVRSYGNLYLDIPQVQPMPGLLEFLDFLRSQSIRMAVVSSTSCKSILTAFNRFDLTQYFDIIIGRDLVKTTKPSPEGYQKAMAQLKAAPEECIAIEDSPIGIRAANNAGLRVIGLKASEMEQDTSAASVEFSSFEECLQYVRKLL